MTNGGLLSDFGRDSRTPRAHVLAVDADRDAHDHVLGPFRDVAVAAHQVGPLQSFEPKIVVFEVAVVDDRAVDLVLVRPAAVSRDAGGLHMIVSRREGGRWSVFRFWA